MRYIGGKSLLIDNIFEVLSENYVNAESVLDIFSGSGVVANAFKQRGYQVFSNDLLYFSYVINRGTVAINSIPAFSDLGIKDAVSYLNELEINKTNFKLEDCFIYKNYSPNKNCERMYFQNKNAIKVDIIRKTVEKWKSEQKINEDEYFYLLACLILAVP